MDILTSIDGVSKKHRGMAVTIGNFDGVHRGHQKIISTTVAEAARLGTGSLAITFEPHPAKVLRPERETRIITPVDEKARLMGHYGIGTVLFIGFSRAFAATDADDFITEVLVGKLGARAVVVGHSYAFGRGKRGGTELLRRRGRKHGFSLKVVRSARVAQNVVSSSRIRGLLDRGKVAEAAKYLGRPYMIEGTVIKGAGRGRKLLETPTANLALDNELIPRDGVYAVLVEHEGRLMQGVANIGTNPTFGQGEASYEVHILDFEGDLANCTLRIHFTKRLRDELKFPNADALHEQILADIGRARESISSSALRPI